MCGLSGTCGFPGAGLNGFIVQLILHERRQVSTIPGSNAMESPAPSEYTVAKAAHISPRSPK
jgi:hypothetical protein